MGLHGVSYRPSSVVKISEIIVPTVRMRYVLHYVLSPNPCTTTNVNQHLLMKMFISDVLQRVVRKRKLTVDVVNIEKFIIEKYESKE